jgi:hypothetical protein
MNGMETMEILEAFDKTKSALATDRVITMPPTRTSHGRP